MTRRAWTRWAPLLMLTGILAACQPVVTGTPTPAPAPTPAEPRISCDDSGIRLLDRDSGIHGAIVDDTLHMGGDTASVTCATPASQSLGGSPGATAAQREQQSQQPQYSVVVVNYRSAGTQLYILRQQSDGTTCVVDTDNTCVAEMSDLPDDFDVGTLPDDVEPTIPAGRAAPAPPVATDTAPDAVRDPHPSDGATGVTVDAPLLSWSAGPRAASYDLYWGASAELAADAALGTPIDTSYTAVTIGRPGETAAEQRLAAETTYYWRVDAKNAAGATRGNVWSFTTGTPPPPPDGGYTPPVVGPPAAAPSVSIADASFPEGSGRLVTPQGYTTPIWESDTTRYSVDVTLSASAGETVRVQWSLANGTATAPADYLGLQGTRILSFRGGDTSEVLYVYLVGDLDEEGDETFQVRLNPLDGVTCGRCAATITITDDD